MDFYQAYGKAAKELNSPTLIAGRNVFQKEKQGLIVIDILHKLKLKKTNNLLEIGCGVGILLNPLSLRVKEAVGIDHPSCIKKYKKIGVPVNVTLIGGRWPETKPKRNFDRILVYSVLHYLNNAKEAKNFIDECLRLLSPGGGLMLGDIPNKDLANRFHNSEYGKKFHQRYLKTKSRLSQDNESIRQQLILSSPPKIKNYLNDKFVMDLLKRTRLKNFESYIMSQTDNLPFSKTREDILIWKHL